MTYLVPVLVRVCDVVRLLASDLPDATEPLVWAYLRRSSGETTWRFYETARTQKRLLLLLDGFDEGGVLGDRLEREIGEFYMAHPLVVTSRDMKCLRGSTFSRFRRVRVLQLDHEQVKAIAKQRLNEEDLNSFLEKLRINASLSRMARNPLLLSCYVNRVRRNL